MKKIHKLFVSLLMIIGTLMYGTLVSCEGTLMETPESALAPENFYKTEKECINAANGCYQSFKDNFISTAFGVHAYLDAMTDYQDLYVGTFGDFFSSSMSASYAPVVTLWQRFYSTIGVCNTTIARVEAADIKEEIKNRIVGEARFLRALNYFYVVQLWGPVPLKTNIPLASDDMNLPRTPIEEIYEAIITDLKFAEENCWGVGESRAAGGVNYTNDKGRVTKGAAKALLAKVYLKIASTASAANRRTDPPLVNANTGQVDGLEAYKGFDPDTYYNLCIQKCNEIEPLGYALNVDYMTNFDITTKNGVESLFEVQASSELGYGSRLAPLYSPPYSGLYGGTWGGTIGILRGWLLEKGPFKVYRLAWRFDYRPAVEGDPAERVTNFQFDITDNRYKKGFTHSFLYTPLDYRLFQWDIATAYYWSEWNNAITKLYSAKYHDPAGTTSDNNSNNFVILRFADVLLMKAECLFETGNWDGAWELIRRVHTRDGNQNTEADNLFPANYADWIAYFSGTTDEEKFRDMILFERFIELNMEGHRFLDLARMGILEEKSAEAGRVKTRKSYWLPISQNELNANEAISDLDNNPGFETKPQS